MPYKNPPVCKVNKCQKPVKANFMCAAHGAKWKRWGDPEHPDQRGGKIRHVGCAVKDCEGRHLALGFCRFHYDGYVAFVDKQHDPSLMRSRGSSEQKGGYVRVYAPHHPSAGKTGYIQEHRMVMEEMIGRQLTLQETVHHKNGDRKDNRPENLELWSCRQPRGQRVEDKVQYALEILEQYAPELLAGDR